MFNTLFIIDDNSEQISQKLIKTIDFETYLQDYPKLNSVKIQIINLCNTERYLGQGYYCSLLAEARQHRVLPTVKTINSLRVFLDKEGGMILIETPSKVKSKMNPPELTTHVICMGEVADENWKALAKRIFQQYQAPLLTMRIRCADEKLMVNIQRCTLADLTDDQQAFCFKILAEYSQLSWRKNGTQKKYRWEMAILVNQAETAPPSNKGAILRFVKAAEKQGVRANIIDANAVFHLNQYDALFLRETTAIDHYTYQLSCEAEKHGLVVIDDPTSILRCCNKVFLHDAFNYHKVSSIPTLFVRNNTDNTIEQIEQFGYPVILKMPEGSFSKAVYKVENQAQLRLKLQELLVDSAIILAQKYVYTEYDWRIGILNGRAIYACRYYMAKNHWQIYNHKSRRHFTGGFDTLPTFEVPRFVLDAALKAASIAGMGFYGVDLKVFANKAYVLEVNDNPSIDYGVEDNYLGEELYMQIMAEFIRRLELRGRK